MRLLVQSIPETMHDTADTAGYCMTLQANNELVLPGVSLTVMPANGLL